MKVNSTVFFDKYFSAVIEYPRDVADDLLPTNTLWCYISSDLLSGLINYVDHLSAFVVERYVAWDSFADGEPIKVNIYNDPINPLLGGCSWFEGSKQAVFDKLQDPRLVPHFKLDSFQDDVVVLAKSLSKGNFFYFFYFDMDSPHSMIGRFKTSDSNETVINNFKQYIHSYDPQYLGHAAVNKELNIKVLKSGGWLTF